MGRLLFGALLMLAAAIPAHAQGGSWASKPPCQIEATDHGVVASGAYMYWYGPWWLGFNYTYQFDPVTNAWVSLPSMINNNVGFAYETYGGILYAFGNGWYGSLSQLIYAFDTTINQWSILPATLIGAGPHSKAVRVGRRVYICGGYRNGAITDAVDVFDLTTQTVSTGVPMPAGRVDGMVGAVGNEFWYMGGQGVIDGPAVADCYKFVPLTGQWSTMASMPDAAFGAATFVLQSRIFVIGGWSGLIGISSANREYATAADAWNVRAPLPGAARFFFAGCSIAGKGYVYGGSDGTWGVPSCDEFTPPVYGTPPADPTGLFMRYPAAATNLSEGDWVCGSVLEFGADIADPDAGDLVRLDVEAIPGGPLASGALQAPGPALTQLTGLVPGVYSWRCRTRDQVGNVNLGGWQYFGTNAPDFTIDQTLPGTPAGISPVNASLTTFDSAGMAVPFAWTAVTDNSPSVTYELLVATDSTGSNVISSHANLPGTTTTIFLPPNYGPTSYSWFIRAIDQAGNPSGWGGPYPFTIFWEDGIDHGAGDGKRACGFGIPGGAAPSLLGIALLISALLRARRGRHS